MGNVKCLTLCNRPRNATPCITDHEAPKAEYGYSSTLSLTPAVDEMGVQRHAPADLPPVKTRYPLYRSLGGHQDRFGRVRKILPPTGIRSPDSPARNESLCQLSHRGPYPQERREHNLLNYLCCNY